MATFTFDYTVSRDGGKTWQPARKTFSGIRNPNIDSTPGEPHRVMFLADFLDEAVGPVPADRPSSMEVHMNLGGDRWR